MNKTLRFLLAVVLVLTVVPLLAAPAIKTLERPIAPFDRAAHFEKMFALQEQLRAEAIDLAASVPLEVAFTPEDLRPVKEGVARQQKMMVGVVRELGIDMRFSRSAMTRDRAELHESFGAVRARRDGSFLWEGVIRSPQAAALRVHLTGFDLPAGSALYVYTTEGMAFGPYTGKGPNGTGDFWTNTVRGSELVLRLNGGVEGAPRFEVSGLGHLTSEFAIGDSLMRRVSANQANCSFNASCVVGAACEPNNAAVNDAKDAVAHILFASGAYLYICSGGLVADSDTSSSIPYFITANHCISRGSEASSLETFFFYTAACGSCPDPGAASTTGSSIVSTNRASDYSLLLLSQNAPSGAAYLGWNSTEIAFTNGAHLYRISHPKGAPQSYSTHDVDTSKGVCRSWPRGGWIYTRDILGATEGGSSGSPVVNAAGQLVGQLSGGCGTNVNDVCDDAHNATVDGAFAAYYVNVSGWLGSGGGGGGCTDADNDGVCASEGDCNDNDPNIYPGANDTKGKRGRDGVDNDCDGIIDG